MPRTCATCSNPKRSAIEAELIAGTPLRNISKRFETSPAALLRHRNRCVSTAIVKAKGAAEVMHGDAIVEKIRQLEADARRIAGRAEREGDLRAALAGVRQLTDLVGLVVSIAGKREVDIPAALAKASEAEIAEAPVVVAWVSGFCDRLESAGVSAEQIAAALAAGEPMAIPSPR